MRIQIKERSETRREARLPPPALAPPRHPSNPRHALPNVPTGACKRIYSLPQVALTAPPRPRARTRTRHWLAHRQPTRAALALARCRPSVGRSRALILLLVVVILARVLILVALASQVPPVRSRRGLTRRHHPATAATARRRRRDARRPARRSLDRVELGEGRQAGRATARGEGDRNRSGSREGWGRARCEGRGRQRWAGERRSGLTPASGGSRLGTGRSGLGSRTRATRLSRFGGRRPRRNPGRSSAGHARGRRSGACRLRRRRKVLCGLLRGRRRRGLGVRRGLRRRFSSFGVAAVRLLCGRLDDLGGGRSRRRARRVVRGRWCLPETVLSAIQHERPCTQRAKSSPATPRQPWPRHWTVPGPA